MENRLKFRVYDIRRKVYFNDPVPPLNSDGTLAFQSSHPDFQKYYITEQCTGLSDKNGNLIYESDYVKANDIIYRVFWNKTKISLVNILNGDIIDISETITMEIVGNEHEKDNISEIPKNPKRSSD